MSLQNKVKLKNIYCIIFFTSEEFRGAQCAKSGLRYSANKETNKQTNVEENITSLAEIITWINCN